MKPLHICLTIFLYCLAGACSDNEDNTPSLADNNRLEALIDHSNADIMDFKQKYGTYILYMSSTQYWTSLTNSRKHQRGVRHKSPIWIKKMSPMLSAS